MNNRIPFYLVLHKKLKEQYGNFVIVEECYDLYEKYKDCYEKCSFESGEITIQTGNGICALCVKNTKGDYLKDCDIIPPYCKVTLRIRAYDELYLYKSGHVMVYKNRFLPYNMSNIQKIGFYIFMTLLLIVPCSLIILFESKGITHLGDLASVLVLAYIALYIYLAEHRNRMSRKLKNEQRIYVDAYTTAISFEHRYETAVDELKNNNDTEN